MCPFITSTTSKTICLHFMGAQCKAVACKHIFLSLIVKKIIFVGQWKVQPEFKLIHIVKPN